MLMQHIKAVGSNTPGAASSAADFRGVLDGFWEGFGTFLASPGELLALFFYDFVAHRAQEAAKRPLSLDLGRVWMDFGKVLSRFGTPTW